MVSTTNGNGHKNGTKPTTIAPIVGHDAILWDGLAPAVTRELDTPIDPALVSQRKGRAGKDLSRTSRGIPSLTRPTASSATEAGATRRSAT